MGITLPLARTVLHLQHVHVHHPSRELSFRAFIRRGCCALLLWALSPAVLSGATLTAHNHVTRVWQLENGLPENNVTAVVQTRDGYIWLGTRNGLARFDGARFTIFDSSNTPEMESRHVTCLFEARDGALWIGHETGEITCRTNGTFRSVPIHAPWRGGKIFAISDDAAGDIWVLNQQGDLVRVRDGFVIANSPHTVTHLISIARIPTGGFWIQRDSQVLRLEGEKLTRLVFDSAPTNRYVQGIAASRDGGLWVMNESRIQKWKENELIQDVATAPWEWSPAHTIMELEDGRLAAATVNHGIYLVQTNGQYLQFARANGLSSDWVTSFCQDREGNLWTGTGNGGLAMIRKVNVTTYNPPDQWQGRTVLSVAAGPTDNLWIGTEGAGVYRYRAGEWRNFNETAGVSNHFIWSVAMDTEHRVWAGSWGNGVFVQNGEEFKRLPELMDAYVAAMVNCRDKSLCIGTSAGLLRFRSGKLDWLGRKPELSSPDVRSIQETPDGALWFGMSGGGLGQLNGATLRQFRRSDGLSSDFVQCLHLETNGTLWIGTFGGGLNRFKDGKFATITKAHGLPNDVICEILDDDNGYFWISSHGGISRVNKAELNHCADGIKEKASFLNYGLSDGLPTLECSGGFQPAGCKTSDGRLWFPTVKGLVCVDPFAVKTNLLKPPVVIEELRVNGHALKSREEETLRVPRGRHRLEFSYTALSFISPEKVRFKHRLEGLEQEWVDAGAERIANYSYIPPGDYTFRVIACNNDGEWNEDGATLAFTVLPHFWQTLWFRSFMGVFVVLAASGLVWFDTRRRMRGKVDRLERQRAIERERARIARDIHDDLGATLTRITMLSQSAHGTENPAQAVALLDTIYGTARELTRSMDEIVWAVNPKHDTPDSLASYLGKYAQDYLGTAGVRCRLDLPVQLPAWSVTAEVRHNLFLAFKEALNNVVKHAAAKEVRIILALSASSLALEVEDDGRGFNVASSYSDESASNRIAHGNGLLNMKRRLSEIRGEFEIQSAPGKGTRIRFTVPIMTSSA
jgi:signal transduction histidine kinase/ligand-binding sensor domain-containing protein